MAGVVNLTNQDTPLSSDPSHVNALQLNSVFSVTHANPQEQKITGMRVGTLSARDLYVDGNIWLVGVLQTPLNVTSGIAFPDGSLPAPSIAFTNDLSSGFFRNLTAGFNAASGGTLLATFNPTAVQFGVPISTTSGNLVINPAGASVDFSGKTLINVGGISTNPDHYDIYGAAITTTDATPVTVITIPTVTNSVWLINARVLAANSVSLADTASFTFRFRISNESGNMSSTIIDYERAVDTPLTTPTLIGIDAHIIGANVEIKVTGQVSTTIKWNGVATVDRLLFP